MENNKHNNSNSTSFFDIFPFTSCFVISLSETIILFLLKWGISKHINDIRSAGLNCLFTLVTLFLVYSFIVKPVISKANDTMNKGLSLAIALIATILVIVVPLTDIISLFLH